MIVASATKSNRILAVDSHWRTCGMVGEVMATVAESYSILQPGLQAARLTHPDAPAPTSRPLEGAFYFTAADVAERALALLR